jgi:uncharacterized protein
MKHLGCTILLCALVSCASTPAPRLYELSAISEPTTAPLYVSIGVPRVSVPAMVDRPQMVVRERASQVRIDDANRWAVPLQDGIAAAIGENLANLLGTDEVNAPAERHPDFSVTVDVQRFESDLVAYTRLEASWAVRRGLGGAIARGRTSVRETVGEPGYEGVVQAHNRAIVRLSTDIAIAILDFLAADRILNDSHGTAEPNRGGAGSCDTCREAIGGRHIGRSG